MRFQYVESFLKATSSGGGDDYINISARDEQGCYFNDILNCFMEESEEDDDDDNRLPSYMFKMAKKRRLDEMNSKPKEKQTRSPGSSAKQNVMGEDGNIRRGTWKDSLWWLNYVEAPHLLTPRLKHKFRRRFRMPFESWQKLVLMLKNDDHFSVWHDGSTDAFGTRASPIELLSLAVLRYLGRKCTFDDLEELTFISERTHGRFFQAFIDYGSTILYKAYVISPQTADEAKTHMHEMNLAGFNGAIGSMDASNVIIINCRYGLRQAHLGHKLSKTARTYNIIVNHRRRILASTGGHPSRWNDKTIVLFDEFIQDLRNGKVLCDNEFELLERDADGNITSAQYKGVWVQVDNGYLEWSITIPPYKCCSDLKEVRWSQWMESMRKDVECTFGILKKRWTILDKGIEASIIENADKVWLTCCALHNMLLEIDGYDELWEGEISSDPLLNENAPFSVRRLHDDDEANVRLHSDNLGRESNNGEIIDSDHAGPGRRTKEVQEVWKMGQEQFRQRLVEHFDILFESYEIKWPTRVKVPRSV